MLTRPFHAPLALFLVVFALTVLPTRARSQTATPVASVADLQLEIRKLRKRSDDLRGELKRQQKAVGAAQHELDAQRERLGAQEAESTRLRDQAESLSRWLLLLGVVSAAGVGLGLLRRSGTDGAPAPLAIARERTGRLHEGLTALEARIQVIERRSSES
jgi:hypothetical protein